MVRNSGATVAKSVPAKVPSGLVEPDGHRNFEAARSRCQDGGAYVEARLGSCGLYLKMFAVRKIRVCPIGVHGRGYDLPAGVEYRHIRETRIRPAMPIPFRKRRLWPFRRHAGLKPLHGGPAVADKLAHLQFERRGKVRGLKLGFFQSKPLKLGNERPGQNECHQGEQDAVSPDTPFEYPAGAKDPFLRRDRAGRRSSPRQGGCLGAATRQEACSLREYACEQARHRSRN